LHAKKKGFIIVVSKSSFCVYLFGLEALASLEARVFLFQEHRFPSLDSKKNPGYSHYHGPIREVLLDQQRPIKYTSARVA